MYLVILLRNSPALTPEDLERHNRAKIIKKSVFLFSLFNLAICCKHVHIPELQQFKKKNCVAHLAVKRDIKTKFPYFLFWTCMF